MFNLGFVIVEGDFCQIIRAYVINEKFLEFFNSYIRFDSAKHHRAPLSMNEYF